MKDASMGRGSRILPPSVLQGPEGFYTANAFQGTKRSVEELSGVSFRLKNFRSTLTTITLYEDLSRLPAMSAQLRHKYTSTTQRSHLRMKDGVAGEQLRDAWREHPIRIVHETPLIKLRNEITGYA